jgi:heme/copper-type cytochrome/quinol oxidase subunit 2
MGHVDRGRAGDRSHAAIHMALSGIQQIGNIFAEMGAFNEDRSGDLAGPKPDYPVSRNHDMEKHSCSGSLQATGLWSTPINVEVVALDWKWLFIYPELGIASINQLEFPVGTPVNFKITSDSVMNSFFIPQLGGQIYAMAGMQTKLHLVADEAGDYAGMSANFSGEGFSDMKFRAIATTPEAFAAWVNTVKASQAKLDGVNYAALAAPSEKHPVQYFSKVDANLFQKIVASYNNGHVRDMTDPICRTKG